uniref:AMP-dependent synthetase/ligase domain-containing protein n=1 Tax=Setaria digitata TaxID=48799 RepID=A0A915PQD7_9BILA
MALISLNYNTVSKQSIEVCRMDVQCPFQIPLLRPNFDEFADYFFDKFLKYGCSIALVDVESGRQWRYSELRICTMNCVKRLQEIGVRQGTRCALICSVTAHAIFIYIACSMLEAPIVSVNPSLSSREKDFPPKGLLENVKEALRDEVVRIMERPQINEKIFPYDVEKSRAMYCFTEESSMSKVENAKRIGATRNDGRVFSIRLLDEIFGNIKPSINQESLTSLGHPQVTLKPKTKRKVQGSPCSESSTSERHRLDEKQLINSQSILTSLTRKEIMFYSINPSKFPKLIKVSYRSLLHNLQQLSCPVFGPPSVDDKCLLAANIHHVFGLVTAFLALKNGAQLIVTPKQRSRQITVAYVVPIFIHRCSKNVNLEKDNLESLKSIVTSGAPISERAMQLCRKRLKLQDLRQAYSITEAGGICSLAPYGQERMKSVGIPLPGIHFKIVDWEMKETCLPGQLGQILIQGPPVEIPPPRNSKQIEAAFASRFFKTGDAGYYDETGHIFVVNKIKDVIKCKDILIWPSAVENALYDHPAIDDCAVMGRWEQTLGTEIPAAFIVKNPFHQRLTRNDITRYLDEKIPDFEKLHGTVHFVPEIPRGACGKLLRPQLKQMWNYIHGAHRSASSESNVIKNKTVSKTNPTKTQNSVDKQLPKCKVVNIPKRTLVHKINPSQYND